MQNRKEYQERMFIVAGQNSGVLGKLIEAVPASWSHWNGSVKATAAMRKAGNVLPDTGISYGPHTISFFERKGHPSNVAELLCGSKKITSIVFERAGQGRPERFRDAQALAASCVRLGYRGSLYAFAGVAMGNEAIRCEFHFRNWKDQQKKHEGVLPPAVIIAWNNTDAEAEERVMPLLSFCDRILPSS